MRLSKQRELEIEKRRSVVASNILAGLNYRDIAKGLGVSIGTIAQDARMVIKRWRQEQVKSADENIQLDLRRIDTALNAIWGDVQGGKLIAIDRMLRLMERRASMLGYDQPEKLEIAANVGMVDIEAVRQKRWQQIAGSLTQALSNEDDEQ